MNRTGNGDFAIESPVWTGTSKVLEEMGELQQVLGKLIATGGDVQHWDGDLTPRLIEEIGDLLAALEFFQEKNFSASERALVCERAIEKFKRFSEWNRNQVKATRR